jgi:Fe-S-cluster containining protein
MKTVTKLSLESILPLTCTRIGTCCHGNQVLLNPFELFCIAKEKQITARAFRDLYCDLGGIRLKFNGEEDSRGKKACSQYLDGFGCSVHLGRPLACRLFPIGRQIQNNQIQYIHQGDTFPCLNGCAEVVNLPQLSVGEYLNGQITDQHEKAQDDYLEVMQNLADIAFELLLDSGLAESGDTKTLSLWREMGKELPELLVKRIGNDWLDDLTIPEIINNADDSISFTQQHNNLLQLKIQEKYGALQTNQEFHKASVIVMGLAIHLARSIGADPKVLSEFWIDTAKRYGGQE